MWINDIVFKIKIATLFFILLQKKRKLNNENQNSFYKFIGTIILQCLQRQQR